MLSPMCVCVCFNIYTHKLILSFRKENTFIYLLYIFTINSVNIILYEQDNIYGMSVLINNKFNFL